MKHFFKLLFVVFTLVIAKDSMALSCKSTDGGFGLTEIILSRVAVDPLAPVGTVVWRSQDYNVDIRCWHENPSTSKDEYIFVFLGSPSSTDPIQDIGGKLQPGIRINGIDYPCSSMQTMGSCGFNTFQTVLRCSNATDCQNKATTFNLAFSSYFVVKTQGNANQEGAVINPPGQPYAMLQIRGGTTPSTPAETRFTFFVLGMDNFRYIGCNSSIDIQPSTITFPNALASQAASGQTAAADQPFSIIASKACTTPYGLAGSFQPASGTLSNNNSTLVPTNNTSVGIQLLDKDTLQKIPFKTEFLIAPSGNTAQSVRKDLLARLVWMKNTATTGPFNASAKLEVLYK